MHTYTPKILTQTHTYTHTECEGNISMKPLLYSQQSTIDSPHLRDGAQISVDGEFILFKEQFGAQHLHVKKPSHTHTHTHARTHARTHAHTHT